MAPVPSQSTANLPEEAQRFESKFFSDEPTLKKIVRAFRDEFGKGLAEYGQDVAMIPSYITGVPDGTEQGTFLALDLGGTNLRVCEVKLEGANKFSIKQQKYKVSDALKQGDARDLFDYIAESVDEFLTEIGTEAEAGEEIHLGFTFSFPVEQTALASGKILTWTKGFSATNAIGNDVVKLLQDALDRKHIHVLCSALVNDTVGTMLSASYQHGPAIVGAIFGTGTNGAYLEQVSKITKLGPDFIAAQKDKGVGPYMVVNTEWGALDNGRAVLPLTLFDAKLDRESINPHKQAFEKLISGMYLGEILRNMLVHFIDCELLFAGWSTKTLNKHYAVDTSFLSFVEAAIDTPASSSSSSSALSPANQAVKDLIVRDLGVAAEGVSEADVELVKWAVQAVGARAAQMSACAIACIVEHTADDAGADPAAVLDVGIDGSVAELYPHFRERVDATLVTLLGDKTAKRVRIGLAKDGSGVGAALAALQAKKELDIAKK